VRASICASAPSACPREIGILPAQNVTDLLVYGGARDTQMISLSFRA
jgi:hypothetical protein